MTVTELRPTVNPQPALKTPAERLADLKAMLDDPRWEADRLDIERAITYLTATTVLAA